MAGILNNKERMIDFVITNQGRRQMSDGRMRVEYASFTDMHTFYQASGSVEYDVAEDASNRIFFEATDRQQDIIVPELDAGYSMQPFRAGDFEISGREIASGTFKPTATSVKSFPNALTGAQINAVSTQLLSSITQNFQDQRILRTEDLFSDTSDFRLTAHTASFVVTDTEADFGERSGQGNYYSISMIPRLGAEVELNSLPSIFGNVRFSHLPNFHYMPPIDYIMGSEEPKELGKYPRPGQSNITTILGQKDFLSYQELTEHLEGLQSLEFGFADSSRENNLIAQIFDMNTDLSEEGNIEKLTVIDFGEFADNDPESPGKHIYFVGKIREDEQGAQTYMNIFTVVID